MEADSAASQNPVSTPAAATTPASPADHPRAVISVVGKDRPGIIAAITTTLATSGANILDISQTILDGFFTMMAIVDISHVSCPFADLADSLAEAGRRLGVQVRCQREEIFTSMERI
jgi:ACT domain-containing protein